MEKRVLSYGLFDVFNADHVQFLRQIAQLGDRVILGQSRAPGPLVLQGATSFDEQRALLEASRYVDRVIPLHHVEQVRGDIVNHDIAILALGQSLAGHFDHLQDLVQVIYFPKGPGFLLDPTAPTRLPATG